MSRVGHGFCRGETRRAALTSNLESQDLKAASPSNLWTLWRMASISAGFLKPNVFISSAGLTVVIKRQGPSNACVLGLPREAKPSRGLKTATESNFGVSPMPFLRVSLGAHPSFGQRNARGDSGVPVNSASRDAGASHGGEDKDEGRWSPQDGFGLYPWDPAWLEMNAEDLQWIQEETITLFTTEGIVKLGGSRTVPRTSYSERQFSHLKQLARLKHYREADYMDPKQGLCLGALFNIAATNGLDMGRRFCVFGFCRSIEMLSDVVEDTVLGQGGEVVIAEKKSTTGLHEKLNMTVAMPALWGVPPAVDVLNNAIRSGGGIVEKTYKKWEFF